MINYTKKKIFQINVSINKINKKFQFSKKNSKILFIGNLKYLPNILAVKNFVKNTLSKLKKRIPNIKFEVVGEIYNFDKFLLSINKDVKCWGKQKNLDKFIKGSFCGLANLEIATGIQGKILSYMSYGLPVICSKKTASNFNNNVISYRNDKDLIDQESLNLEEKKWLNNYHKTVFKKLKNSMNKVESLELKKACSAI